MKRIVSILFPVNFQMNILQLENYDYSSFIDWISRNFLKRSLQFKKPLILTLKVKLLYLISFLTLILITSLVFIISKSVFITSFTTAVLLTHPFILFILAGLILKPYEMKYKKKIIKTTHKKISNLKNLKIITITGSYGKSSTKEILYHILKDRKRVLRTPDSYNTTLGISKVVEYELDDSYDYFICEMAAYKKGEIAELCNMVPPDYGILTGISKQHLVKFGSLKNIISAKFELADVINNKKNILFNLDNKYLTNELIKRKITSQNGYGINANAAKIKAKNISFNKHGSQFTLIIKNRSFPVKSKLFGYANISNILAATAMAITLDIPPNYIINKIENLRQFPSRFVLTPKNKATLIDNTYSSNTKGFQETIKTAKHLKGSKVLVTPGLVELGKEEDQIHVQLGKQARGVFDKFILVGKTSRTASFAKGLDKSNTIKFIQDNREDYFKAVDKLSYKYDWIFLENDITQNY